jgi:hypothetical protein
MVTFCYLLATISSPGLDFLLAVVLLAAAAWEQVPLLVAAASELAP